MQPQPHPLCAWLLRADIKGSVAVVPGISGSTKVVLTHGSGTSAEVSAGFC